MAPILQHQQSNGQYKKNNPGCLWGWLQIFNFHQRLHLTRMLTNREHGDGKHTRGVKISSPFVPLTGKKQDLLGSRDFSMDKITSMKRSSRKDRMIALIFKILSRKQYQKRKLSHAAPQLLRTNSIHHLECNDYVLPNEVTCDIETSTVDFDSHETNSSGGSEQVLLLCEGPDGKNFGNVCAVCRILNSVNDMVLNRLDRHGDHSIVKQPIPMENFDEAKKVFSRKSSDLKELGRDAALKSKDITDMQESFNTDTESFQKKIKVPNLVSTNQSQGLHASSKEKILSKSGSYPRGRLSGRKYGSLSKLWLKEIDYFAKQRANSHIRNSPSAASSTDNSLQAITSAVDGEEDILDSESSTMDSYRIGDSSELLCNSSELKGQKDHGFVLEHLGDLKRRISDPIEGDRIEHVRIPIDGVLHKIPRGQKVSEDVMKEMLHRSVSDRYNGDFRRNKIGLSANGYPRTGIQKSHSLTESLDRYSYLYEVISKREPKRLHARSKSIQEKDLNEWRFPKTLKRSYSSPESRSYSLSKDVQSEEFSEALPSKILAIALPYGDVGFNIYGSDEPTSVGSLVGRKERVESDAFVEHSVEENSTGTIDEGVEQPVSINGQYQNEIWEIPDSTDSDAGQKHVYEPVNGIEEKPSIKPEESSSNSVLDSNPEEDPVSPPKFCVPKGSEAKSRSTHSAELNSLANPEDLLVNDIPDGVKMTESSFDKVQPLENSDSVTVSLQTDERIEAVFSYARDMLTKPGFSNEEFLGAWNSALPSVHSLQFGEAEDQLHETGTVEHDSNELSLDDHLLLDLSNEVLSEIYEESFAGNPWFSGFASRARLTSTGSHVYQEVLAKVRWHLGLQTQLNCTLESIFARDFATNDRWMDLRWDAECEGMDLEGQILEDLLDEFILDLDFVPT